MRFQLLRLPSFLAVAIIATGTLQVDVASLHANTIGNPGAVSLSETASRELHIAKKRKKNRKQKKSRSRRSSSRRYTLRGNPEVTRTVATNLIAERLPELADLVGIPPAAAAQPVETPVQMNVATTSVSAAKEGTTATETPTAGTRRETITTGTTGIITTGTVAAAVAPAPAQRTPATVPNVAAKSISGDYSDSELSEEEDPDKLTLEDEEILAEEDDLTIDEFYSEFTDYMASLNGNADMFVTDNGIDKVLAMETLMEWLGTRYLFGGSSRSGIDCSAFTRTMYGSLGCPLPRTAAMQWEVGDEVAPEELQFGDLIFFHTRAAVYVSHVGMYLGNNMFAHASSRNGVTVSSLESDYYSTHFIGARRYDVAAAKAQAALEMEAGAEEGETQDQEVVADRVQGSDTTQVQ